MVFKALEKSKNLMLTAPRQLLSKCSHFVVAIMQSCVLLSPSPGMQTVEGRGCGGLVPSGDEATAIDLPIASSV